jgi:hypothetical protein
MSMGSRLKRILGGVLPRLKGVVEVNASVAPLKKERVSAPVSTGTRAENSSLGPLGSKRENRSPNGVGVFAGDDSGS